MILTCYNFMFLKSFNITMGKNIVCIVIFCILVTNLKIGMADFGKECPECGKTMFPYPVIICVFYTL